MIRFEDVTGKVTLGDHVKSMSFEELKETFEGKLDYVSLANQLGIKPSKPVQKPKSENSQDSTVTDKEKK
jgi:hypothetical protein